MIVPKSLLGITESLPPGHPSVSRPPTYVKSHCSEGVGISPWNDHGKETAPAHTSIPVLTIAYVYSSQLYKQAHTRHAPGACSFVISLNTVPFVPASISDPACLSQSILQGPICGWAGPQTLWPRGKRTEEQSALSL